MNCILCAGSDIESRGHAAEYALWWCRQCLLGFSDPMRQASSSWYGSQSNYLDYNSNPFRYGLSIGGKEALKYFKKNIPKTARILDVGCGNCLFVYEADRAGYQKANGVDFDNNIIAAADRLGLAGRCVVSSDVSNGEYACATAFEVLEHVEDPLSFVRMLRDIVEPGGYIVVSVPNAMRVPDIVPKAYDSPPHHMTRWTPESLKKIAALAGLNVVATKIRPYSIEDYIGFIKHKSGPIDAGFHSTAYGYVDERVYRTKQAIIRCLDILLYPYLLWLRYMLRYTGPTILLIAQKPMKST